MNKKICLIEDNLSVNKLFSIMLKKEGYEVASFTDAKTFLDWTENNQADLIVMDIILPDINGMELLKLLKNNQNFSNIPVIATTGMASESSINSLIAAGFSDVITKPLDKNVFIDKIKLSLE